MNEVGSTGRNTDTSQLTRNTTDTHLKNAEEVCKAQQQLLSTRENRYGLNTSALGRHNMLLYGDELKSKHTV